MERNKVLEHLAPVLTLGETTEAKVTLIFSQGAPMDEQDKQEVCNDWSCEAHHYSGLHVITETRCSE